MTTTNLASVLQAATALAAFRPDIDSDHEAGLGDLLCDLMHWADAHNLDFEAALFRAQGYYLEECAETAAEPEPAA